MAQVQHFGHIGNLFTCAPGKCDDCENYTVTLNEYEEDLRQGAIKRAKDAIQVHIYSSKRRTEINGSGNLIDFENENSSVNTVTDSIGNLEINQQTPDQELNNVNANEIKTITTTTNDDHA